LAYTYEDLFTKSGLWCMYPARTVRVDVLDDRGEEFASFTTGAMLLLGTCEYRTPGPS
jgi:hypothetical protein